MPKTVRRVPVKVDRSVHRNTAMKVMQESHDYKTIDPMTRLERNDCEPNIRVMDQQRDYDYSKPGLLTLAHRQPDNLIGKSLIDANKFNQMVNLEMMKDQNSSANKSSKRRFHNKSNLVFNTTLDVSNHSGGMSGFPPTTNQEVHNGTVFRNMRSPVGQKNNRKITEFLGYVNATFNSGVY